MKPNYFRGLIIVSAGFGLIAPQLSGQGVPSNLLYGSQTPIKAAPAAAAPFKRGREKTEEIDIKKVPTKGFSDSKFQGSLLDVAVDSTADIKAREEKPKNGNDKDSKTSKPAVADTDSQKKDQKTVPAQPTKEKASANPTEKAAATKPDGSH